MLCRRHAEVKNSIYGANDEGESGENFINPGDFVYDFHFPPGVSKSSLSNSLIKLYQYIITPVYGWQRKVLWVIGRDGD